MTFLYLLPFLFLLYSPGAIAFTTSALAHWQGRAGSSRVRLATYNPSVMEVVRLIGGGKPKPAKESKPEPESSSKDHEDDISFHHYAIKTANIFRSMCFYTLLGFTEELRFMSGPGKATWLKGPGVRLELIEVPEFMNPAEKALDLGLQSNAAIVGLNHVAIDVTKAIKADPNMDGLRDFLIKLNKDSEEAFDLSLKLVLPVEQRMISSYVFEIAFIADAGKLHFIARNGAGLGLTDTWSLTYPIPTISLPCLLPLSLGMLLTCLKMGHFWSSYISKRS
ncbi:unnamed protein product [Chrysoparadoxa australica]